MSVGSYKFLLAKRRLKSGTTLMEILSVMAVLSVVGSVALPAVNNFFSGQKVTAQALEFVSHIRTARSMAIESQAVHRLVFDTYHAGYKVEVFRGYDEDVVGVTLVTDHPNSINFNNSDWKPVLSESSFDFDPGIEVTVENILPNCLFFWPNGKIVTHIDPAQPLSESNIIGIPECYVMMVHGNGGIRIILNAYGVFASESYSPDDDFSDDESIDGIW